MQLNQHSLSAIVVAGGTGSRMGLEQPKQFALLGGKPILIHTLQRLLSFKPELHTLVLVIHSDWWDLWQKLAEEHLGAQVQRILTVAGGDTRTQSVWNGLRAVAERMSPGAKTEASLVAIQDGVRPFLTHDLLRRTYELAATQGSGIAAVPVKSSLRQRMDSGSRTVDRSEYFAVQTPQTFRLGLILDAYKTHRTGQFTDDASVLEAAGQPVYLCEGDYDNIKITTPADMEVAQMLLRRHEAGAA